MYKTNVPKSQIGREQYVMITSSTPITPTELAGASAHHYLKRITMIVVQVLKQQYNEYIKNFTDKKWDLKEETIKYCVQDCKSLFLVLEAFFKENYENTRVIVSKYVSLPSLAFANFRTIFLDKDIQIFCLNSYQQR